VRNKHTEYHMVIVLSTLFHGPESRRGRCPSCQSNRQMSRSVFIETPWCTSLVDVCANYWEMGFAVSMTEWRRARKAADIYL
jgi:hypothetical protein